MIVAKNAYSHCDGHFNLGDGIHRTTHERSLEHDVASNAAFGSNHGGGEIDLPWKHEEIVIGESAVPSWIHEFFDRHPIRAGVFFQLLERTGRVKRRHVGQW